MLLGCRDTLKMTMLLHALPACSPEGPQLSSLKGAMCPHTTVSGWGLSWGLPLSLGVSARDSVPQGLSVELPGGQRQQVPRE